MVPWSGPAEFWFTGTSMTDMSGLKSLGTFLAQLYTKFEFIGPWPIHQLVPYTRQRIRRDRYVLIDSCLSSTTEKNVSKHNIIQNSLGPVRQRRRPR